MWDRVSKGDIRPCCHSQCTAAHAYDDWHSISSSIPIKTAILRLDEVWLSGKGFSYGASAECPYL